MVICYSDRRGSLITHLRIPCDLIGLFVKQFEKLNQSSDFDSFIVPVIEPEDSLSFSRSETKKIKRD